MILFSLSLKYLAPDAAVLMRKINKNVDGTTRLLNNACANSCKIESKEYIVNKPNFIGTLHQTSQCYIMTIIQRNSAHQLLARAMT